MDKRQSILLSVVVPIYNEANGLDGFNDSLLKVLGNCVKDKYEVIYCDDGSADNSSQIADKLCANNSRIRLIKLSRNFGKESALTAGIAEARGQAILTLDGDGQHPVELLPLFLEAWRKGVQVVIGIRVSNDQEGIIKRLGSGIFYRLFNSMTDQKLLPNSTDFRLIDSSVQRALLTLPESDRITRGLIDWLGFRREYIQFKANPRNQGTASYSLTKLIQLATNSFVSLTPKPLHLIGYSGIFITLASLILGVSVFIEQLLLGDPLRWKFTGTSMLSILTLFLVGIVLISQGIMSLYISHIHSQSKRRPLYVIDYAGSIGISEDKPPKAV